MEIANQLDYKKVVYTHPTYRYNKVLMQRGGQQITFTSQGGNDYIFEIPVKVINLAKSYFTMKIMIPSIKRSVLSIGCS